MSKSIHQRRTVAALLGAAALAASAPAASTELAERRTLGLALEADVGNEKSARSVHVDPVHWPAAGEKTAPASEAPQSTLCEDAEGATLRTIIEDRVERAERAGRYEDVDELATLWLTLERRQQLDRVVSRGEQFVNVSLRNQKRSEQRSLARDVRRHAAADELELPTLSFDVGQALDAEAFVSSLEEPYRSAVRWTLSGMNHREVAEQMGASHAAVRKWAQRLRDRLATEGWELHKS